MNKLEVIENPHLKKDIPSFRAGDQIKVHLKVKEGDKTRIQIFEGVCIRKRGGSVSSSFSVLKETNGSLVEKIFPLHSPTIDKIEVSRKGKFKRSRLYHLRNKK